MEHRLHILHLEDSNNDAELVQERLKDEGGSVKSRALKHATILSPQSRRVDSI